MKFIGWIKNDATKPNGFYEITDSRQFQDEMDADLSQNFEIYQSVVLLKIKVKIVMTRKETISAGWRFIHLINEHSE